MIQILILSLELKNLDFCPIITLCLEFHLFRGLIYFSTIGDGNFLTPIINIFRLYEEYKLTDKPKEIVQSFGYRCLWYIKMCLEGLLINGEKIDESSYSKLIQQIVLWIFVKENVVKLIEIDIRVTLKVFLMLFKGKPADVIKQNYSHLKITIPDDPTPSKPGIISSQKLEMINFFF